MTDETPDKEDKKTSAVAIGAAAIGSAAIAAALLYAGRRFRKKPEDKAAPGDVPSGEPPETD
ncbi:MAG: isopropylmalate isomerase [Pseudomonadota bacterium]